MLACACVWAKSQKGDFYSAKQVAKSWEQALAASLLNSGFRQLSSLEEVMLI